MIDNLLFEAGDVVRLKSGGPRMTVSQGNDEPRGSIPLSPIHPSQEVSVEWFVNGMVHRDKFLACELVLSAIDNPTTDISARVR